jgi:hypothetical protein
MIPARALQDVCATSGIKTWQDTFLNDSQSYTARIRFGHPNGVTKAPRTRLLCKNLSQTELSEN